MKWLLQNSRKRALFALKNPRYTFVSMMRELAASDERFIGQMTGTSAHQIRHFINEPFAIPEFVSVLVSAKQVFSRLSVESAEKVLMQYAAVRAVDPEYIAETGVANGVSSAYLLLALMVGPRLAEGAVGAAHWRHARHSTGFGRARCAARYFHSRQSSHIRAHALGV